MKAFRINRTNRRSNTMKTIATIAATVLITLTVGPVTQSATAGIAPKPYWTTTLCRHDWSINCYHPSSSVKRSYVTRTVPGRANGGVRTECVFFTDRAYAKTHDRCYENFRRKGEETGVTR